MIDVRRSPIDVAAVVDRVRRDDAGAIVVFLGSVRADAGVRALDYEVYEPMARKALQVLADRAKSKFGLLEVAIVHRVGHIPIGEDSVAVVCAAAHRAAAFAGCEWAMDEVKRIVPIWKTESSAKPARRSGPRRRTRP
ncbi:MAG TPA: molybdenum cofactor biosynthesis protein MoaE [Thermoplasmata archaeon]|nr:molybdenum cofactor biosynthesis protein MoaE [Thermoplasmata archaeon]